jgi:2-hydroxy-3-oxopropionate reductase
MTKPRIGFIGLGLMGRAMVGCLQEAGYAVTVLGNRDRSGVEEAVARGGTEAQSARALAEESDIVMLCVATSAQVEGRIYGEDGVLAGARADQVVIDFGTSLPGSTQTIAEALAEKGAQYLDAPLGRTPAHAKEGKLNIMCAGDKAAYDRVKPVLDVLGENVFHLGKTGNGHTIKLINNFFAMTTATAMSEAFAMADAAGIERSALFDVAFSVENGAKDVGYYGEMAEGLGRDSRMSKSTKAVLEEAKGTGDGGLMIPQMVDWMVKHLGDKA